MNKVLDKYATGKVLILQAERHISIWTEKFYIQWQQEIPSLSSAELLQLNLTKHNIYVL